MANSAVDNIEQLGEPEPLINDGIHTEDQLGYEMYAKVLHHYLKHVTSPLTIGIFSKWGSGKSFLLRLAKDSLQAKAEDPIDQRKKWTNALSVVCFSMFIWFGVTSLPLVAFIFTMDWILSVALLLIVILIALLSTTRQYWKVLICVFFAKMPRCKSPNKKRKFIYVDFNAWEHGGSDDIWAAIVTSIVNRVEKELGTFNVRLFRTINFKESQDEVKFRGLCKHMIHCCTKGSFIRLVSFILFVIATVLLGKYVFENNLQKPACIPPVTVVGLGAVLVLLRSIYALLNSQTTRINRALNRTRKNMSEKLGFMKLVKDEVMAVSNLLRSIEYVYNKNYKIVLAIDDLDRVTPDKVRSVLEAVNILLSDHSSPIFCLIAVDPMVAVNSIDGRNDATINVTKHGHEYLKKIINVPFCLPEVATKIDTYLASILNDKGQAPPKQNKWSSFDRAYADWVAKAFLQTKICKKHILPNARNIKRLTNVVSMATTFAAFHHPKGVILDMLSICRGEYDLYSESQVRQDNESYANILEENGPRKNFVETLLKRLPLSNIDGTYAHKLRKYTLEVCKSSSEFANNPTKVTSGAASAAEKARNAASQATEFVFAATAAKQSAEEAIENAKTAARSLELPIHEEGTSESLTGNVANECLTKVFMEAQSDEEIETICQEAERVATKAADDAEQCARNANDAAAAAKQHAKTAAEEAARVVSPRETAVAALEKVIASTKTAKIKIDEAINAQNIAISKAKEATSIATDAHQMVTKFITVKHGSVLDVRRAIIKDFCENLILLIMMIEQWPFMTSLLLQQLEKNCMAPQKRALRHMSMYKVYNSLKLRDFKPYVAVDGDPLVFESLLKKMDESNHRLNATTAHSLRKYAINFDHRQMQTYLAGKEDIAS